MSKEYKLQDPGEGIQEADILAILVEPGDEVSEGDHILDAETDKSAVEIRSDFSGTVQRVNIEQGQKVQVGDVLMTYDDGSSGETSSQHEDDSSEDEGGSSEDQAETSAGEASSKHEEESSRQRGDASTKQSERDSEEAQAKARRSRKDAEAQTESEGQKPFKEGLAAGKKRAAPSTRKLARDRGVELDEIEGTGPAGRVLDEDVLDAADEPPSKTTPEQPSARGDDESTSSSETRGEEARPQEEQPLLRGTRVLRREPMSRIRRATARRMTESSRTIPHVMHHDVAPVDELLQMQREHAEQAQDDERPTLTAYLVKALAAALRRHPEFNVRYDEEADEVVLLDSVHIGVAVATEQGLLVPALRDAERKSLREIARELRQLASRARAGELTPEDMRGASATITNVGAMGGRSFTPIINPPEVSILGVGAAYPTFVPSEDDGAPKPVTLLPLSFCFDHRVNDGAQAAHFVSFIKEALGSAHSFVLLS